MRARNAVAALAVLCLAACGKEEGGDGGIGPDSNEKSGVFSVFDPVAASPSVPFPFDGFFSGATDPTLNIPNAANASFVSAANELDGFSTTASLFTDLLGELDFATLSAGLKIVNASTGAVLVPGVDYTVQASPALDASTGLPIDELRSRVLIEPLKPLAPSTRYVVVLTPALRSADGLPAVPSEIFRVVRSATPVAEQSAAVLSTLTPTQKATLEALRTQLIRPIVVQLGALGITEENVVLAWSFTTQSVSDTLARIEAGAVAPALVARDTGLTLAQVNPALPAIAKVYAGTVTLPYFLSPPGTGAGVTDPLTRFWQADAAKPALDKSFLGQVPCGAYVTPGTGLSPSVSTTVCFPEPVKQADVTVPVLMTVPNAASGRSMPEGGWPVVVFQHGITGDRSQMLALAPALTLAGFAVVAIDLPLHGIVPTSSAAALRIPGVAERSFDLDLVNNASGAAGPDGEVDGSGTHFINLSSLLTSRDNLRQAVSDLIHLVKALPGVVLLGSDAAPDGMKLDGSIVRYAGHSLGGIVLGTYLGIDAGSGAATLAMPGGGIGKLLDASNTFGPRIRAGLEASGVIEGSDNYETFLRFAQTAVDSGDPVNYSAAAAERHPIHMIEVLGDLVLPNEAPANAGAPPYDRVTLTGYLSGTGPLYQTMSLIVQGPLDVPLAQPQVLLGAVARHNAVQFNQGDHGSILDPTASPAATQEMQRQTASFLASNGLCLPIGGSCP